MSAAPRNLSRIVVACATMAVVAGAVTVPTADARPGPPAPPTPVPAPVSHPARDGGHAGGTVRTRGAKKPDLQPDQPRGTDVSGHQGVVDWAKAWASGAQFVYVKSSEGTDYVSDSFTPQYEGAKVVGMLRGAYHFALPDRSPAVEQANYFVDHGGTWSDDGRTLPPMIDIEDNPYGDECYGLAPPAMADWLTAFSDTVRTRTGKAPTIYTSTRWWRDCTGDSNRFGANPLFLAHYDEDPGPMPASWPKETIWQYDDSGDLPGDQDVLRGSRADLDALTHK